MKALKQLQLVVILALTCQTVFGQIYDKRHEEEKYWKYRDRLKTEFVVVGSEQGESIPAHEARYENRNTKNKAHLQFGDGGINLGWYIGMLATEFRLLKDSGMPVEETKRELYLALNAYERMDKAADSHPCVDNPGGANNINGFFIRDDVDDNLFENNPAFAERADNGDGTYAYHSDFNHPCSDNLRVFLSPDQVASLFLGFALVKKCVPSYERYNGVSLAAKAKASAKSIADHYKRNGWDGKGPNGENNIKFADSFRKEYEVVGFAKAADWIVGEGDYLGSVRNTLGWFRFGVSKDIWRDKFDVTIIPLPSAQWGFINSWNIEHDFAIAHNMIFGAIASNVGPTSYKTRKKLSAVGKKYRMQIYPLLNSYLHGTGLVSSGDVIPSMRHSLATAPCSGPHYYRSESRNSGVGGWRTANRWIRAKKAIDGLPDNDRPTNGDFNGLDYMVAHNVFLLYNREKYETGNTAQISGEPICGTGSSTYSITGIPRGRNVTWSTSSNLRIVGSRTGRQVAISLTSSSGNAWVEAKVTHSCGAYTIRKPVAKSAPSFYMNSSEGNTSFSLNIVAPSSGPSLDEQGITTVTWEKVWGDGTVDVYPNNNKYYATISGNHLDWSIRVKVTATNKCGSKSQTLYFSHEGSSGGGPFQPPSLARSELDEKPSQNNFQYYIYSDSPSVYKANLTEDSELIQAALYDYNGKLIKTYESNTFGMKGLSKGVYILKAELKSGIINQKIIIN